MRFKWKVHESTEQKLTHTALPVPTSKPSSTAEGTAGGNQVRRWQFPLLGEPISASPGQLKLMVTTQTAATRFLTCQTINKTWSMRLLQSSHCPSTSDGTAHAEPMATHLQEQVVRRIITPTNKAWQSASQCIQPSSSSLRLPHPSSPMTRQHI